MFVTDDIIEKYTPDIPGGIETSYYYYCGSNSNFYRCIEKFDCSGNEIVTLFIHREFHFHALSNSTSYNSHILQFPLFF